MAWQEDDDDFDEEINVLARSSDPETSHAAGRKMTQSGKAQEDRIRAKQLVYMYHGRTARELDHINGTPEGTIRKRLAELERMGLVEKREPRISIINGKPVGKKSVTWGPPTGKKQMEMFQ